MTTSEDHAERATLTRTSLYTRRDAIAEFGAAVNDAFHDRRGRVRKHDIIAGLLRVAVAHRDELPQYLVPETSGTHPEEDG